MSYTDKNKIEQLEQKVAQLERKLEQMSSKEEIIRDMENRLGVYDDTIRSDNGKIVLKKNFIIENRRGVDSPNDPGTISPKTDNTVTMFFNDKLPGRINGIYIGDASAKGNFNNSTVSVSATKKSGIPPTKINLSTAQKEFFNTDKDSVEIDNRNNGRIQMSVYEPSDFNSDGVPVFKKNVNFLMVPVSSELSSAVVEKGRENTSGIGVQLVADGDGGASLGHVTKAGTPTNYITISGDGIALSELPTTDPSTKGQLWNDGGTVKISLG